MSKFIRTAQKTHLAPVAKGFGELIAVVFENSAKRLIRTYGQTSALFNVEKQVICTVATVL
jgi:hypothetical protein